MPSSVRLAAEPRYNVLYVGAICAAAAMGGLLFGYDWVVIGGAKPFFEKYFDLTTEGWRGWANSCALVGCLVGAMLSGVLSDRFGRKRLLILAAFLFFVSSIETGRAGTFPRFAVWRILGGVAIGLASNLSPMYIAEVSPARIRGQLVSMNQLTIVIGVLAAQIVNWLIAQPVPEGVTTQAIRDSWNGQTGWRWMFAATAVPAAVFLLSMLFVPESPRWLAKNGRADKARAVLRRIGGVDYAAEALVDIEATLVHETGRVRFGELLAPKMRKILFLGIVLAVFQQWCGINVIFNYAEEIFRAAGYHVSGVMQNIVYTGLVMLAFTFVAIFTVERLGRRALMLLGAAGLASAYTLLGAGYHAGRGGMPMLLLVLAAIACYSFSLAPITWVVLAEIFPNRIRGAAMSVAVFALWAGCFTLTYTFPFLHGLLGPARTFWTYAAICAVGFVFLWRRLPETRGKTLEQIERELVD